MGPREERRSVMRARRGLRDALPPSSDVKKPPHLDRSRWIASSSGTAVSSPCSGKPREQLRQATNDPSLGDVLLLRTGCMGSRGERQAASPCSLLSRCMKAGKLVNKERHRLRDSSSSPERNPRAIQKGTCTALIVTFTALAVTFRALHTWPSSCTMPSALSDTRLPPMSKSSSSPKRCFRYASHCVSSSVSLMARPGFRV